MKQSYSLQPAASCFEPSHVAFIDESSLTQGRFRSIGVVSAKQSEHYLIADDISTILSTSGISGEFKWQNLKQARERIAAHKLIDYALERGRQSQLRVDIVCWDTRDSRHNVHGIDHRQNAEDISYFRLRNVLQSRWPGSESWYLYPDQGSIIRWPNLYKRLRSTCSVKLLGYKGIHSHEEPLCQLADLFAGLIRFGLEKPRVFERWRSGQHASLSDSDRERSRVMDHLLMRSLDKRLGLRFSSVRGLETYSKAGCVDFWLYTPKRADDKAPVIRRLRRP